MADEPNTISRREFTALSIAAGVPAAAGASGAAAAQMVETDVQLTTPAALCDAALIHQQTGSWPGVILFPDVFGLRPTMRDMAKRLAADGFTVLVPNPFYRTTKPPVFPPLYLFHTPRRSGENRCIACAVDERRRHAGRVGVREIPGFASLGQ